MTREQHMERCIEFRNKSMLALTKCVEHFNQTDWEEYKKYSKLANKEYGIARMMLTKEMKKLDIYF